MLPQPDRDRTVPGAIAVPNTTSEVSDTTSAKMVYMCWDTVSFERCRRARDLAAPSSSLLRFFQWRLLLASSCGLLVRSAFGGKGRIGTEDSQ